MSSVRALATAIVGLIPASINNHTEQVRPDEDGSITESLPWVVTNVHIPDMRMRSLSRRRHGGICRITTTIAGANADSVRIVYEHLAGALEGARPVAEGWNTSPIEEFNARPIDTDDRFTITDTNRHPVYTVVEWQLTVSERTT